MVLMTNDTPALEFTSIGPNPYALGTALEFISRFPPFSDFGLGSTVNAVGFQLRQSSHLIAVRDDRIVGYLGWVVTTEEVALDWLRFGNLLTPDLGGDCVVPTIFAVEERSTIRPLLNHAREVLVLNKVYWQRYFADGRPTTFRTLKIGGDNRAGEAVDHHDV